MLSRERWMWATVVLAAAGVLGGCAPGEKLVGLIIGREDMGKRDAPGQVAGGEVAGQAGDDSAAFLDRVSALPEVTESDVVSGMLLLMDGQDAAAPFARRVDLLKQRRMIDASWSHDASRAVLRGRLAYMVCVACDIKGGVILRLFGPSQRYCLRELQYMRMMGQGNVRGKITGMELVAVLNRAEVYRRTGKVLSASGEIRN